MPVIDLFPDGMYDEEETIKRLLPQKLKDQYTFRSDSAIALLRFGRVMQKVLYRTVTSLCRGTC